MVEGMGGACLPVVIKIYVKKKSFRKDHARIYEPTIFMSLFEVTDVALKRTILPTGKSV